MRTQLVPAARLHRGSSSSTETSKSVLGVAGSKRQLRARKHQGDEFPESRGLNFNKVPGVANVLQKFSKNPANELEAEQLFLKLNLANAKSTLFENPQFQAWSARVVKGHQTKPEAAQTAIAATLTKQLGDEALAKMIAAAKEVEGTKSMAAQLEQAQLKNWLSKERNANYVFKVLQLHKETYSNPLLNTWASYAKMLKADPPMLLFDKMKAHYSDATIANLLASAKRENAAPFIVDDVENLLFDTWMAKRRTGDEIFTVLGLNHHRDHLFNVPEVSTWVSYVSKLDREGADEQIYKTLTKYYSDHDVTVMLAGSKKYLSADVANKLEEMLHSSWLEEATTANKMFAKLKLDNQGENLFESPAFSTWVRYVTKLDAQNAGDLMLAALKTSYTDDALANLLVAARANDNTKVLADKLAGAQRKDWLNDEKSADDVFKLLKLDDDAVGDLMKSPLLGHWEAYVSQQLRESPYEILLVKLKAKFPDSEGKFADMLMNAKQDASTSVIAGKIEAAQLEKWSGDGKTAGDVFKLFGFDREGTTLLWYRRVRMWAAYVSKVEAKNSDETMASVLKAHYDDYDLGMMIAQGRSYDEEMTVKFEELVQKMWLSEGKSADDVFNYVLKRHQQFIFEIPRDLNTWVSYVTKLDEEGAYKAMFAVLNRRYDEKTLAKMLNKAEDASDTKRIAEKLEQELWLSKGQTAENVFYDLNLHRTGEYLFESSVLYKWVSYAARVDKKNADQTMLSVLEGYYKKEDLVRLLATAKEGKHWKDLAARLEQLLAGQ